MLPEQELSIGERRWANPAMRAFMRNQTEVKLNALDIMRLMARLRAQLGGQGSLAVSSGVLDAASDGKKQ